jgi:HK97 family phage major capsid protein
VTIPMNAEATIDTVKSIDASQRAALGTGAAASDDNRKPARARDHSEGTAMFGINELQTRRDEVAGRMKELWAGCEQDRKKLSPEEASEFDGLKGELRDLDVSLEDQRAIERASTSATPARGDTQAAGARSRQALPAEPKRKEEPKEKGIAFAQYVRLMYHGKGMPMMALALAERRRGSIDPRVTTMLKAAVEAGSVSGSSTAGGWGMELVGDETGAVADFAEWLRPQTIIGKFGTGGIPALRRVPFRVPLVGMASGMTGYWVGEGKAKPLTKASFARTTLEPLKVAAITAVTKELLADSSPSADTTLRDELAAALIERTDIDFVDPNKVAVSGISPASITYGVTPVTASGTGDAADIRADVRAVMANYIAANNPPTRGVWIMSATSALSLSMMQNALGQAEFPGLTMNGGTFAGLPVIVSEHVPGSTAGHLIVLVNASDIYYNDDGGVQVDTSEHASLEMDDAPSHDSVTPTETTLVSMYQTNSVAFRAERRIDWLKRRPTAVQMIENANWGEAA